MANIAATPEEQLESLRRTPRMTVAEAMNHQWTGPVALVNAIDGCGADQLTTETAPWLYRQGLPVRSLEKLFGVPYAQAYSLAKGSEPPAEIEKVHTPIERRIGRQKPVTTATLNKIRAMKADGETYFNIKERLHVSSKTITKAIKNVTGLPAAPKPVEAPIPAAAEPPAPEPALVVETVKVTTYKPIVPEHELATHRDSLEWELRNLDHDIGEALKQHEWDGVIGASTIAQAISVAIDLMSAEIARCQP